MVSPSKRPGGGRWWRWRILTLTRGDLLTFLVAAMLCSASYCLSIWHNSRGAADSRVLGASWPCGSDARAGVVDADEPLDFEAHHTAESAGLSVSASAAATSTKTRARRALSGELARAAARRPAPGGDAARVTRPRSRPVSVRNVSTSDRRGLVFAPVL